MDNYLSWNNKTISDFSSDNISTLYGDGFVFTRLDYGVMTQTRSVRINLAKFELNSENRRILRKTENIQLNIIPLPHPNYDWHIHKIGFDFYTKKFGEKTFSANKIKDLLTNKKSNFNILFEYTLNNLPIGYCIGYANKEMFHYCYPFYNLNSEISNLGIGMMTKAILWAKEQGKEYIYLGSAKDIAALYKTQFEGFEWFDGKTWQTDITALKETLTRNN